LSHLRTVASKGKAERSPGGAGETE